MLPSCVVARLRKSSSTHTTTTSVANSHTTTALQQQFAAMSDICVLCSKSVGQGSDAISCYGVCGNHYHHTCLTASDKQYKKSVFQYLSLIPNLHWYCNDCVAFTLDGAFNGILDRLKECAKHATVIGAALTNTPHAANAVSTSSEQQNMHQQQQQLPAHTPCTVQNQPNAAIALSQSESMDTDNTDNIDTTKSDQSYASTLVQGGTVQVQTNPLKRKLASNDGGMKRLRSDNDPRTPQNGSINSKSAINSRNLAGSSKTHQITASSLEHHVLLRPKPKLNVTETPNVSNHRYLYVSPFEPDTSETDIMDHLNIQPKLKGFLGDIKCTKLLSNKKKSTSVSFVSFKVAVPANLFERFTDSSIWPTTLSITEFVDKKDVPLRSTQKNQRQGKKPPKHKLNKVPLMTQKDPQTRESKPRHAQHPNMIDPQQFVQMCTLLHQMCNLPNRR